MTTTPKPLTADHIKAYTEIVEELQFLLANGQTIKITASPKNKYWTRISRHGFAHPHRQSVLEANPAAKEWLRRYAIFLQSQGLARKTEYGWLVSGRQLFRGGRPLTRKAVYASKTMTKEDKLKALQEIARAEAEAKDTPPPTE